VGAYVDVHVAPSRCGRRHGLRLDVNHTSKLPTNVPTMMRALVVRPRGVGGIIICQVDRLLLPTLGDFDQRCNVAIVQLAGELQGPINEHADRLAEEFFGSNGRPELAGALGFVADLVETLLNPQRRSGFYPAPGGPQFLRPAPDGAGDDGDRPSLAPPPPNSDVSRHRGRHV
jgi:hypothetical protein